jgi:LPXTG-motif cell wall-anchored protein
LGAESRVGAQTGELSTFAGSGVSPLSALLALSNSAQNGFVGGDSAMATEQGFRALVAYQGFVNTGGAYNIYVQATDGVAGLTRAPAASENAGSSDGEGLPATGDSSDILAGTAAILVLCACGVLGYARKQQRQKINSIGSLDN